jgi:hypothetical protein
LFRVYAGLPSGIFQLFFISICSTINIPVFLGSSLLLIVSSPFIIDTTAFCVYNKSLASTRSDFCARVVVSQAIESSPRKCVCSERWTSGIERVCSDHVLLRLLVANSIVNLCCDQDADSMSEDRLRNYTRIERESSTRRGHSING